MAPMAPKRRTAAAAGLMIALATLPAAHSFAPSPFASHLRPARAFAVDCSRGSRGASLGGVLGAAMDVSSGGDDMAKSMRDQREGALNEMRQRMESQRLEGLRSELLYLCDKTKRGIDSPVGSEMREKIVAIMEDLEKANPIPEPLASPVINGEWVLRWTTSESILGRKRPYGFRVSLDRPILQVIDTVNLKAKNFEPVNTFRWIFGGIKYQNSVEAELEPISKSNTKVIFRKFNLFGGIISIKAPEKAKGMLDTTYLHDGRINEAETAGSALRISRGDKGNLFILTRAHE